MWRQPAPCAYGLNVIFCHATTPTSSSASASSPAPTPHDACVRKSDQYEPPKLLCHSYLHTQIHASPATSHHVMQNTTTIATPRIVFFMRADYHPALLLWDACHGCWVREWGSFLDGVAFHVAHRTPVFFVSECLPVFLGAFNCDTVARSTAAHECSPP